MTSSRSFHGEMKHEKLYGGGRLSKPYSWLVIPKSSSSIWIHRNKKPQSDPTNVQHPAKSYVDLLRIHHDIYKVSTPFSCLCQDIKNQHMSFTSCNSQSRWPKFPPNRWPAIDDLLSATLGNTVRRLMRWGSLVVRTQVYHPEMRDFCDHVPEICCGGIFEEVFCEESEANLSNSLYINL